MPAIKNELSAGYSPLQEDMVAGSGVLRDAYKTYKVKRGFKKSLVNKVIAILEVMNTKKELSRHKDNRLSFGER